MARIFISHSREDTDIVNFFGTICDTTQVKKILKEIEGFRTPEKWAEIQNDIQFSKAIFVILGPHVQEIRPTRDWVVWESALASPMRKDIWVFEPYESLGNIDVIIPHVDHYMVFQQTKDYQEYIKRIIESYDDSAVLPAAAAGGLLFGPLGILGGALIADPSRNRPPGEPITCVKCQVSYHIHMRLDVIRCPACNTWLKIDWKSIEAKKRL